MTPRARRIALVLLLALIPACASTPPRDALAVLAQGEGELTAGRHDQALALLASIDEEAYVGEDLERYKLAKARAKFGTGDAWGAFNVLKRYLDDHPLTAHANAIERLTFDIGKTLIGSDKGFWILWSDADDGAAVLQHFVRRFPNSEHAPDAYHLLGELEWNRGNWLEAQQQFRQITMFHDRSAWASKALFRDAMAGFHALAGPDYDLQSLERTQRELATFVAHEQENLAFKEQTAAALGTVNEWLAAKHVGIADFYATVDNLAGQQRHLELATRYENTQGAIEARQRLSLSAAAQADAPRAIDKAGQ
jgi:outer membrane protein assembly factor BamD (BamD/ComL family)